MAEVLITLGIIGVVAAMTMPTIMANVQKTILKQQFKKFYTNFSNGIEQVKINLQNPYIECYYWDNNPYGSPTCQSKNEYGTCTSYTMSDGSPLPSDYNGRMSECKMFGEELFGNVFKIAKFCNKNALSNGCLTDQYIGLDKVSEKVNYEAGKDPNGLFNDSDIKTKYPVWILNDGTVFIKYLYSPLYAVDVNGHKGPNKWGHDIFLFRISGNSTQGIKRIYGAPAVYEKGGTSYDTMFEEAFSK